MDVLGGNNRVNHPSSFVIYSGGGDGGDALAREGGDLALHDSRVVLGFTTVYGIRFTG